MANQSELKYVKWMEEQVENYYPGMCFDIEQDFPELDAKKFWARMFCETAREIFERRIGIHDYNFWQTQRIFQVYGTGNLFEMAVRETEPKWRPNLRDHKEFDEWANARNEE